jgi:hypothetical protein
MLQFTPRPASSSKLFEQPCGKGLRLRWRSPGLLSKEGLRMLLERGAFRVVGSPGSFN